jgi:ribosomal protein L37E
MAHKSTDSSSRLAEKEKSPSITCPECLRVSYSLADIQNQYCGKCGFHANLKPKISQNSDCVSGKESET